MGHDCKKNRYVLVCMRYRAGCLMRLPLINPRLEHGQVLGWPPGLNKDRAGDELLGSEFGLTGRDAVAGCRWE